MNKREIIIRIQSNLLKLNFNITSIGFKYWIRAIYKYKSNMLKYNTIELLYDEIAKEYNTTRDRVERSMRTARKTASNKIQEVFNYNCNITNKSCLILISTNYDIITNYSKVNKYKTISKEDLLNAFKQK